MYSVYIARTIRETEVEAFCLHSLFPSPVSSGRILPWQFSTFHIVFLFVCHQYWPFRLSYNGQSDADDALLSVASKTQFNRSSLLLDFNSRILWPTVQLPQLCPSIYFETFHSFVLQVKLAMIFVIQMWHWTEYSSVFLNSVSFLLFEKKIR